MNRPDAKKIALTITNEQIQEMFNQAKNSIKDWTKVSIVNKSFTKGTAWNILAKDFDATKKHHNLAKINMVREFGEFLPDNLKIKKQAKNYPTPIHQEPVFLAYYAYGAVAPEEDVNWWNNLTTKEKIVGYFTAQYGDNFTFEMISDDVLDEFCENNKIDKTEAIEIIKNHYLS